MAGERATTLNEPVHHRVVAAVVVADGQVLLCHRRPDLAWYADVWDLPGGHVEQGETAAAALARELGEELGIKTAPPDGPPVFSGEIGTDTHITIWAVHDWVGAVTNQAPEEHDRLDWFDLDGVMALRLADEAIGEICSEILHGPSTSKA